MARARFIKPEFFMDEKIGELPYGARLLFESIWCQSDLRGIFEYSIKRLRVATFPFDEGLTSVTVQGWFDAIESKGMVGRFEARTFEARYGESDLADFIDAFLAEGGE